MCFERKRIETVVELFEPKKWFALIFKPTLAGVC